MTDLQPNHVQPIVQLLLTIRPEWNKHYTAEAVRAMRLISPNLERILIAAVRGAYSPHIAKPDVLAMTGDHWKQTTSNPAARATIPKCNNCWDHHLPDTECSQPPLATGDRAAAHIAALRTAHHDARQHQLDEDTRRREAREA